MNYRLIEKLKSKLFNIASVKNLWCIYFDSILIFPGIKGNIWLCHFLLASGPWFKEKNTFVHTEEAHQDVTEMIISTVDINSVVPGACPSWVEIFNAAFIVRR